MSPKRQRQIAELIHQVISDTLQTEIRDPRIGFVTITGVEVNPDYTLATVYFSLLTDDRATEREVLAGLESAKPFLKRVLGKQVKVRQLPDLTFRLDRSLAYAAHIEDLLSQVDIPPEVEDSSDIESESP